MFSSINNNYEEEVIQPVTFSNPTIQVGRRKEATKVNSMHENEAPKLNCFSEHLTIPINHDVSTSCSYQYPAEMNRHSNYFMDQVRKKIPVCEEAEYAFQNAVGHAAGKVVETVNLEKVRENTLISHQITNVGFLRGKQFADGEQSYHVIANGRLVGGTKWENKGEILFSLKIQNPYGLGDKQTPITLLEDMEDDKKCEIFISKYFFPTDTRVYSSTAIKDFRSRIYEFLSELDFTEYDKCAGWKRGNVNRYVNGAECPLQESILSRLRRPENCSNCEVDNLLREICGQLLRDDFEGRIRFLLGFGLTTWFSSLCSNTWGNRQGLLLTGEQAICREYAEHCLKMYQRETGPDIIELINSSEKSLAEYIEIIRDDAFVLDCYETTKKGGIMKSVVSGGGVLNHRTNVPVVVLQNFPEAGMEYPDFGAVDLFGFARPMDLFGALDNLKELLLKAAEVRGVSDWSDSKSYVVSYEDIFCDVLKLVKTLLLEVGASLELVEQFVKELDIGRSALMVNSGACQDISVRVFKQRLRKLVQKGDIRVAIFSKTSENDDENNFIWVHGNAVYIPAQYLNKCILPLLGIKVADFKRIRDMMVAKNLLHTYDAMGEYTKKISLPSGHRTHAYVIEKNFIFDDDTV